MASFSRRVVLDIGASGMRMGEVFPDKKGNPAFRSLKSMELGIDPTKPAELFPAVLQQLESFVKSSGIKSGPTTLCLGGPTVFTRVIKVPQTDPTQVKQMVRFEAQQAIPAIEEACWDFQIFPSGSGEELEAMILAIKKESVEEMIVAATKAGLLVDRAELAPAALINAFRYNYPESQTSTLILEVGARSSNIVLVEGNKIFCRIVPLGGASVTQSIATDMQEVFAGAETLKKAKGFVHPGGSYEDPPDEISARISKLARGVVTRLHTEVERSITFYRSQQGGNRPSQLLLAGGGVELGLMDLFFREKLKIPVQYFQPFRRISVEGEIPVDGQRTYCSWACWVGTALGHATEAPCRFNVMSQLKSEAFGKIKDRPLMLATVLALGILLFLPAIHGFWQGAKVDSQVAPQKDEVDQAESLLIGLQSSTKKVQERIANLESALRLEEERLRWPLLLAELAKRSQPGMWITRLAVIDEPSPQTALTNPPKPGGGRASPLLVELSGIFEAKSEEADAQVVDSFCRSLEQGGILQKVVTVERETPERSADGKTEQVALRFAIRGEWMDSNIANRKPGDPAKKP